MVSYLCRENAELMCSVSMDIYWVIDPYGLSVDVYSSFGRLSNLERRNRS